MSYKDWNGEHHSMPIHYRDNTWTESDYEYHFSKCLQEVKMEARSSGQSKRHSWYETFTGTFTGFLGSFAITYLVMKYAPWSIEVKTLVTTLLCTVWSIVRGYYNRRLWNWMHTR